MGAAGLVCLVPIWREVLNQLAELGGVWRRDDFLAAVPFPLCKCAHVHDTTTVPPSLTSFSMLCFGVCKRGGGGGGRRGHQSQLAPVLCSIASFSLSLTISFIITSSEYASILSAKQAVFVVGTGTPCHFLTRLAEHADLLLQGRWIRRVAGQVVIP